MKLSLFSLSCLRRHTLFPTAAASIVLVLSALAGPVQACMDRMKLNPNAEAHYLEFADKSVRFASNRLELNQDDLLFILLPNNSEVTTSNGDATLNYIRDIGVLKTARFTEVAPPRLISGANVVLQNSRPGYLWMALQAMRGNTTLTVNINGTKSILNVTVKPYAAPAPEPVKVSLDKATQDKPFGMRASQEFEITLPGQLADGWSIDIPKESGVRVTSLTPAKPDNGTSASAHPMVRLQFDMAGGSNPINIPQHISIKRGGVFNGETFDVYLVFYPIPTC